MTVFKPISSWPCGGRGGVWVSVGTAISILKYPAVPHIIKKKLRILARNPHSSHFFFGQPTPFELESRESTWIPGWLHTTWILCVSREPARNPRGIHVDSLYILVMFWGSKKHPGIQGIHVDSLLVPWIPHGIHKECVGEGKELHLM